MNQIQTQQFGLYAFQAKDFYCCFKHSVRDLVSFLTWN